MKRSYHELEGVVLIAQLLFVLAVIAAAMYWPMKLFVYYFLMWICHILY